MNWKKTVCLVGAVFFCTSMLMADEPSNSSLNSAAVHKTAVAQGEKPNATAATQVVAEKQAAGHSKPAVDVQKRILAAQSQTLNLSNKGPANSRDVANDNCADAIEIFEGSTAFTNVDATTDGPTHTECQFDGQTYNDVWFIYNATQTGQLIVDTCGTADYDTDLVVYDGCDCANLVLLACSDDFTGCAGYTSKVTVEVVAGNCYLVRVGSYNATSGTGSGTLNISYYIPPTGACCVAGVCETTNTQAECVAMGGSWVAGQTCPEFECPIGNNDYCADAIPLSGTVVDLAWDNTAATDDGPALSCQSNSHANIWYCWSADEDADVLVSLCGSTFDTTLAVYDGCGCSTFTEIACNDDSCGLQSELRFPALGGQSYLIYIGGYSTNVGTGVLNITPSPYLPGACCVGEDCIGTMTAPECAAASGRFFEGENCDTYVCLPSILDCPSGTLAGQGPPDPDGSWTFANGDADAAGTNYLLAESFADLTGTIYDLHWWGLWAYNSPSWAPCVEPDPTLTIKFFANSGGQPGAVVCEYTVVPTWVPTGEIFADLFDMLYFSVDLLDPPCNLASGWVSIQGAGSNTCWFLWASSDSGDGQSWVSTSGTPGFNAFDLSYCLTGEYIPYHGACCDDATSTCTDDVEIIDCDGRFAIDTLCDNLEPACGAVTGACCYDDGTCEITTQAACSGMWLGAWTTCDMCPCIVTCPQGAAIEQEPCGSDMNGGCNMDIPTFNPINLNETVCGTMWAEGGTRDTDWYEIVTTEDMIFTFSAEAEFAGVGAVIGLVATTPPGNPDCATASSLSPYTTGGECQPISITTSCLPAGTYWFFVGAGAYEGLPCGANSDYICTLTAEPCVVMGACCYDDGYECIESSEAECAALPLSEWWANETCATHECDIPCTEATIDIEIHTDNYPGETSWEVTDYYTGAIIDAGGPYSNQQYTYQEQVCVPFDGCYTFTILDSWGDGICCSYGIGYYNVYYQNELICTGGEFGLEESCEQLGTCIPPSYACCSPDLVCIGDMIEDDCLAQGGRWIVGELCAEGYVCIDCDVDWCLEAPVVNATGSTCGAGNDCALRASTEIEYRVTLLEEGTWTFSLCGSDFDTYLFVGTTKCGQEIGYNDDFCGLQSELTATVPAGEYYITIEAYGDTACGNYVLNVYPQIPCDVECPPDGTPEGEPDCYENYDDMTNGGCNSTPYVFSPITCGETVCGTSGTYLYNGSSYRDTDWFEIEVPAEVPTAILTWEVCATFDNALYILDANQGGCDNIVVAASATGTANVMTTCQASVGPGTYWLFVGPSVFTGVACGSPYVATLTCEPDFGICGDFDSDNDVDVDDFYFFLDAYGTCLGDLKYEAACDFDGDECITLVDYQMWMQCYRDANGGKSFVVPRPKLSTGNAVSRPAGQNQAQPARVR